jgi:hypothetical protein
VSDGWISLSGFGGRTIISLADNEACSTVYVAFENCFRVMPTRGLGDAGIKMSITKTGDGREQVLVGYRF